MKRVLLITQNFYPEIGSAANRMKNIYTHLTKNGYDVHVLTTEPSYPNETMYQNKTYYNDEFMNAQPSINIIRLHMRHEKQKDDMLSRLYYYTEFMIKVHQFVKYTHHLFDIVYVTSPNIFAPWGTLFLQREFKALKILEIRDMWPDSVVATGKLNIKPVMPILKRLEKRMYLKADKLIVNNESFIEPINTLIHNKRPFLFIPNGMNTKETFNVEKFDTFSVIYTGNLGFAQDFEQLKQIARRLNDEKITFNAVVYGVHSQHFKTFVEENKLHYVHVINTMPRMDCLRFTSKHHVSLSILKDDDVFLHVMPGKIVDAICAHVPVLSNIGGSANELINQYEVGFAKERATIDDIIEAIMKYKHDRTLLSQHAGNTERLKNELFIWEKNIKKIINYFGD